MLAVPVRDGAADLSEVVSLRGSGMRLFELWTRGASEEELVQSLVKDGASSRSAASRDAREFLLELHAWGFLQREVDFERDPEPTRQARRAQESTAAEVGSEDLVRLARAVLDAGARLRFEARGLSMRPWIPDRSTLEVAPRPLQRVRRGEVALYSAGADRLVAHRVVGRREGRLLARGDSAARLDEVFPDHYLGIVTSCRTPGREWVPVSSGWRRVVALLSGDVYRIGAGCVRGLVVAPLRLTYRRRSWLRASGRAVLRVASDALRTIERLTVRLRRPLDVLRSALLTAREKDEQRRRLYGREAVQGFAALDENITAGPTLLEEVLLSRHPPAGSVLVLGCGPGRECLALAERGLQVTGLDREEGMLERAKALAAGRGLAIRLVHGEAHDFAIQGDPFDVVVLFSGLYNMVMPSSRRVSMLRCAREHLRPGGRVLLTFLSAYVPPGAVTPPRRRTLLEVINREHQDGDVFALNEVEHIFPRGEDVAEEAREAGFEVVDVFRDQRAYDRAGARVRGYAVLRRPA